MVSKVKDTRPVNLDIGTMRLPITAWASITHRASGVFLFVAVAILIWMLDASLRSPESFASLQQTLSSVPVKLVLWAILAGVAYHTVAGIKHLIMDFGLGESMEGGILGARIVIISSIVLTLLGGIWIW
jgi:succinate dehydrogenase / fumarate reductase cytochrome b subunit